MKSSQSGFTLIELLVSTIVLSVGLLGLAQLEIFSMRHSHDAYLRTQATFLAQDIADRMRANIQGVNNGDYDRLLIRTQDENCLKAVPGCSSKAMALNDAWEWWNNLRVTLPSGEGIVCLDSSPQDGTRKDAHECDGVGTLYTIKIWWDEKRDGGPKQRFVTSFRP